EYFLWGRFGYSRQYPGSSTRSRCGPTRRGQGGKKHWSTRTSAQTTEVTSVFNLSDRPLTLIEISLLEKGLSFAPTSFPNPLDLEVDLHKFGRDLRLKEFFKAPGTLGNIPQHNRFKPKSSFDPPNHHASIRAFLRKTQDDFSSLISLQKKLNTNISTAQRSAIKSLAQDKTIAIRPADKGGTVVVMNYKDYRDEIMCQLQDPGTYRALPGDPTVLIRNKIESVLLRGLTMSCITQDLYNFLLPIHPRTPILYTLPKIHKNATHPPSRPIVSACGGLLEPLSKWLDFLVKESVMGLDTCLKDTPQLITDLRGIVLLETEVVFMTSDVKSLYTVIPTDL
uniref:Reverse transcriptase domain-containing protein n=1 Tax=Leptobrachium leishanense TaxID=445787 RepID=A0A8C5PS46_9ANUR